MICLRILLSAALAWALSIGPANAASAFVKYKFDVPPSADLSYSITSLQSGIQLKGDALVRWRGGNQKFSAASEARAMLLGKILDSKSEGLIDAFGLAPVSFTEKRFRRDPTTTTFDRSTQTIRFAASDLTYPIKGGEQDRNSVIWQLISVARAAPAKFKPGSEWVFFVAGQRDAEPWTFKVAGQEKIGTPLGQLNTVHILRAPPPDAPGQRLDIWLTPQQEWYPARLRFTEKDGEYIEQTLEKIDKKG